MIMHKPTLDVDANEFGTFYVKRNIQPRNTDRNWQWLIAGGCLFSRLVYGLFIMDEVNSKTCEGYSKPVRFSPGGGCETVLYQIDGAEVALRFDRLIGFSKGIKFKFYISITPGSLCLGKILYASAYGNGFLLFHSRGCPQILVNKSPSSSTEGFSFNSLMAWTLDTSFSISASPSLMDCYMSDVNVKCSDCCTLIIDAPKYIDCKFSFLKALAVFARKLFIPF